MSHLLKYRFGMQLKDIDFDRVKKVAKELVYMTLYPQHQEDFALSLEKEELI